MVLRRSQRAFVVAIVIVAVVSLATYGFAQLIPPQQTPSRLLVVASFYPLQEFTQRIAGSDVSVEVLVPPGVEPHDWEPTPSDISLVARSDLLVYTHPEFERYVADLLGAVSEPPPAVATSDGLELLTLRIGDEVRIDPHIWLDPILAQHQVVLIRDALIAVDPELQDGYRSRADQLLSDLQSLHELIVRGLEACELRTFIAAHAAFNYFARRYGLTLESVSQDPEMEPSTGRLLELILLAQKEGISVVYTEPLVSPQVAEALAEEIGGVTLPLDPLEGLPPDGQAAGRTYFSIMEDNLDNLRVGLRCDG